MNAYIFTGLSKSKSIVVLAETCQEAWHFLEHNTPWGEVIFRRKDWKLEWYREVKPGTLVESRIERDAYFQQDVVRTVFI